MNDFGQQLQSWSSRTEIDLQTFMKAVAFRIHNRVVERTPVDKGRARASWNIVSGENEDLSVVPEGFVGGGGGRAPSAVGGAAAGAIRASQGAVGLDWSYVVSNNLPYIQRLEEGHSDQAPVGMAALAVAEVQAQIEMELG